MLEEKGEYFYMQNGIKHGLFSLEHVQSLFLEEDTLILKLGEKAWQKIQDREEFEGFWVPKIPPFWNVIYAQFMERSKWIKEHTPFLQTIKNKIFFLLLSFVIFWIVVRIIGGIIGISDSPFMPRYYVLLFDKKQLAIESLKSAFFEIDKTANAIWNADEYNQAFANAMGAKNYQGLHSIFNKYHTGDPLYEDTVMKIFEKKAKAYSLSAYGTEDYSKVPVEDLMRGITANIKTDTENRYAKDIGTFSALINHEVLAFKKSLIAIYQFAIDELWKDDSSSGTIFFNGYYYGTITSLATGKVWLDRNLEADRVCQSTTDEQCYGGYYAWNENFAKTDGTGVCPNGFHIPTEAELSAENIENAQDAFEKLKIPLAGDYSYWMGAMYGIGSDVYLWSSTPSSSGARRFHIHESFPSDWYDTYRGFGLSLRCVQ